MITFAMVLLAMFALGVLTHALPGLKRGRVGYPANAPDPAPSPTREGERAAGAIPTTLSTGPAETYSAGPVSFSRSA
jgi:hypothetical protein